MGRESPLSTSDINQPQRVLQSCGGALTLLRALRFWMKWSFRRAFLWHFEQNSPAAGLLSEILKEIALQEGLLFGILDEIAPQQGFSFGILKELVLQQGFPLTL